MRSAGRPLSGVVLSIQDADGKPVPPGETGEVCARAGNFMREYWNKPEATADAFRDGWYHTGDAGYLDANGYLFLVDRVKDMIVTGGENVYSVEVENAIVVASRRRAGRGDRHPVGASGARPCTRSSSSARARRHRRRDHRAHPRMDRRLQGPEVGGDPHRAAAAVGRDEGA